MNNLELDVILFQRATQIMGTRWLSATKVASPDPICKVMSAMMAGEESKRRHPQRWSSGSRCWEAVVHKITEKEAFEREHQFCRASRV